MEENQDSSISSSTLQNSVAEETKTQEPFDSSQSALQYVREFCTSRETWKFMKHRQMKILKIMYDTKKVSDEDFEYILEYMHEMKGQARSKTLLQAEQLIEQPKEENVDDQSILKENISKVVTELQYERARKVIQILV